MVGSMCDSFRQADESMSRVKLNLIEIPSVLRSTIKLLSSVCLCFLITDSPLTQDERKARAFMLNIYLKRLNIAAEVCETEAETVVTKFRRTIEVSWFVQFSQRAHSLFAMKLTSSIIALKT